LPIVELILPLPGTSCCWAPVRVSGSGD
jgi:hypothetical protein